MSLTHFSKATFSSSLLCHPTHVLAFLLPVLSMWHLNLELSFILTFPQICICPYWTCVFTHTNAEGIYLLTLWTWLRSILKHRPFFWGWFSVSVAYYGLTSVPLDLYSASQHAAERDTFLCLFRKVMPFFEFFYLLLCSTFSFGLSSVSLIHQVLYYLWYYIFLCRKLHLVFDNIYIKISLKFPLNDGQYIHGKASLLPGQLNDHLSRIIITNGISL